MKQEKLELIIPVSSIGKRADVAIQDLLSNYSRAKIQEWIKSGFILLESKKISPKDILMGGERVFIDIQQDEKELQLEELQEDNPLYFIDICKDKDLALTALINEALSAEALRKVGNSILDGDITLGDSMEGAVLFLKDKKNSNVLTAIKAKLKAFA